jgi:methyltransferase (TIGR00027 family)
MRPKTSAGPSDGARKADISPTGNEGPRNTGFGTAMQRAAHQILDHPKIFDDPLALRIIGVEAESALRARLKHFQKPPVRDMRAYFAVRYRYVEDELARSVQRGVRQYVILGAGLDTFAYRNSLPDAFLRVFEVDHPATQQHKRNRLEQAAIAIPDSVSFVAFDFERQGIADALRQAGFRCDEPAFFAWLGVARYLSRDAVMSVLTAIRSSATPGSEVIFDCPFYPSPLQRLRQWAHRAIANRRAKKPRLTYFGPSSLRGDLKRIGFSAVKVLGPEEMEMRYCKDRPDGLRVSRQGFLVMARV